MLPNRSGQIPETAALYTYVPNTGRGEFTPREKSEVKTERTPVVYGLPGLRLNYCRVKGTLFENRLHVETTLPKAYRIHS
jgi:hypothetical protein